MSLSSWVRGYTDFGSTYNSVNRLNTLGRLSWCLSFLITCIVSGVTFKEVLEATLHKQLSHFPSELITILCTMVMVLVEFTVFVGVTFLRWCIFCWATSRCPPAFEGRLPSRLVWWKSYVPRNVEGVDVWASHARYCHLQNKGENKIFYLFAFETGDLFSQGALLMWLLIYRLRRGVLGRSRHLSCQGGLDPIFSVILLSGDVSPSAGLDSAHVYTRFIVSSLYSLHMGGRALRKACTTMFWSQCGMLTISTVKLVRSCLYVSPRRITIPYRSSDVLTVTLLQANCSTKMSVKWLIEVILPGGGWSTTSARGRPN